MHTLFISDLHLDASRPAATQVFTKFLQTEAPAADALYILGDLFEACTGNDPLDELQQSVAEGLAKLSASGIPCYLMYGNRDFLISQEFVDRACLTVLHDPTLIYVGGESVLISHGDIFCTDDVAYQRYRRVIRNPLVRKFYDSLPFGLRNRIVNGLRSNSEAANQQKSYEVMDVNPQAIEQAFRAYHPTSLLHGHTHRCAIHTLEVDGIARKRIVLGDWYNRGSVLRWDNNGPQFTELAFD